MVDQPPPPHPRNRRRTVLIAGAAAALLLGLGGAYVLANRGAEPPATEAPINGSGLQVEIGRTDPTLDPAKPLRCFVEGRLVGEMTLNDCAERNGVATGALDVGLDPSGAIVAGEGAALQPLPQPIEQVPQAPAAVDDNLVMAPVEAGGDADAAAPTPAASPGGACWRYNGVTWRKISDGGSLNTCVQALFAGRCERPGAASYGRWSNQTLRLVTGRVERSYDNRSFRTLVSQPPGDCGIPTVGD
jgi:hypothetical protein